MVLYRFSNERHAEGKTRHRQTNKQTYERTNERKTNKHTNKQTNTQTSIDTPPETVVIYRNSKECRCSVMCGDHYQYDYRPEWLRKTR